MKECAIRNLKEESKMKILNSDCVEYISYDSEEEFEKDSILRKVEGWKVLSIKYPGSPKIIKWVKIYEAENNSLSEPEKFCVRGIKLEKII